MNYMQKYYHKGGFVQEFDEKSKELANRDFTTPTGMDLIDKEFLPKPMLARGDDMFKKGRSKWTNLQTEDTSQIANSYYLTQDEIKIKRKRQFNT